ncbi:MULTISPECIES: YdcF family protein [unclassified Sinorhizobium]|uniref:YdcF family protein n=1 Tax=unclassified Sinorhizobium TaxID=2613772 RepID=UPI003525E863
MAILLAGFYVFALVASDEVLVVHDPLEKTDIIVVLGGDGPPRATHAAELWQQGLAPRILVSGSGDCLSIRDAMINQGVGAGAISVECKSASTWENAEFSAPLLKSMNVHSGALVTSWFHSRRALDSFAFAAKEIAWVSWPVERNISYSKLVFDHKGLQITKEYLKLSLYKSWFIFAPDPS